MPDLATLREVIANISIQELRARFPRGARPLPSTPAPSPAIPVAVGYFASGARDARHAFLLAGPSWPGHPRQTSSPGVLFAAAGNFRCGDAVRSQVGDGDRPGAGPTRTAVAESRFFPSPKVLVPKGRTATYSGAFLLGSRFLSPSARSACRPLVTILTVAAATGKIWYSARPPSRLFPGAGPSGPGGFDGSGAVEQMRGDGAVRSVDRERGGVALVLAGLYMVWSYALPGVADRLNHRRRRVDDRTIFP